MSNKTVQVDRTRFLVEGYLVLRGVIPPAELEGLRQSYGTLVERQRAISARERQPGEPQGGQWEMTAQPRLILSQMDDEIDRETIKAVDIWLHDHIYGVSADLLGVEDPGVVEMMMLCNPSRDWGTGGHNGWHRDVYPPFGAPIQGYTDDIIENGPRYVQWNIPLYDDDVLWVLPGSHRRLNTAAEDRHIRCAPRTPMTGGVQTRLRAGDGVVYITPLLHWGSRYDAVLRETLHGGFAHWAVRRDVPYNELLSPLTRAAFARWNARSERIMEFTEAALRAAAQGDAGAYRAALEGLHPGRGPKGQALTTVFLCRTAQRVYALNWPDDHTVDDARRQAAMVHPLTLDWGPSFAERFTAEESRLARTRFAPVDAGLTAAEEQAPPGYEDRPSRYNFNEMPKGFDLDEFLAGW